MANEAIAYYDAGADITGHCSAAVTGKRFVKLSATRRPGGPAGISDAATGDGNVVIAPADAAGRVFGVATRDGAIGAKVDVMRAPKVVPVTALGALNAFQEVEVGAGGTAAPKAAGIPVGYVLADCANGADAQVSLYSSGSIA
jgi:hypothetical protein